MLSQKLSDSDIVKMFKQAKEEPEIDQKTLMMQFIVVLAVIEQMAHEKKLFFFHGFLQVFIKMMP